MKDTASTLATLNFLFATEGKGNFFLRMPLGVIFLAHGAQKLFGWFNGQGLDATAVWMSERFGGSGMFYAASVGSIELIGGILLILGFFVRPAAFSLVVVMMVAIRAVHWEHGLFLENGGFEFALSLLAGSAALMFGGGGQFSIDRLIAKKYRE